MDQDSALLLLASLADLNSFMQLWTQRSAESPSFAWKSNVDSCIVQNMDFGTRLPPSLACCVTAFKVLMSAAPSRRAVVAMKRGARGSAHSLHPPPPSFLELIVKSGAFETEAEPRLNRCISQLA